MCVCVCVCVCACTCVWRVGQQAGDSEKSWCCSLNPNAVWRKSFFFLGHLCLLSLKTFNWFYEVHWHYGSYPVYQNILINGDWSHEIKRCMLLGRKAMSNLDSILKSKDISDKGPSSQSYGFSSTHIGMWELDYKDSWVLKNWCFWTMVLEKTL